MNPTTDPSLRSFVTVEPESYFPIQNLPYGVFRRGNSAPAVGVAIGDFVLDLAVLEEARLLPTVDTFSRPTLNWFMAAGRETWSTTRAAISRLLRADTAELRDNTKLRDRAMIPLAAATMLLPAEIGDYTDFY